MSKLYSATLVTVNTGAGYEFTVPGDEVWIVRQAFTYIEATAAGQQVGLQATEGDYLYWLSGASTGAVYFSETDKDLRIVLESGLEFLLNFPDVPTNVVLSGYKLTTP